MVPDGSILGGTSDCRYFIGAMIDDAHPLRQAGACGYPWFSLTGKLPIVTALVGECECSTAGTSDGPYSPHGETLGSRRFQPTDQSQQSQLSTLKGLNKEERWGGCSTHRRTALADKPLQDRGCLWLEPIPWVETRGYSNRSLSGRQSMIGHQLPFHLLIGPIQTIQPATQPNRITEHDNSCYIRGVSPLGKRGLAMAASLAPKRPLPNSRPQD